MYFCTEYFTSNRTKIPYGHKNFTYGITNVKVSEAPCAKSKNEDAASDVWTYSVPLKYNLATKGWDGVSTPGFEGALATVSAGEPAPADTICFGWWFPAVFGVVCVVAVIFLALFVVYYYKYRGARSKLKKATGSTGGFSDNPFLPGGPGNP